MAVSQQAGRVRWTGRPVQAAVLRCLVYLAPLGGSVVFVHFASRLVPAPAGSLWLFLSWWLGLSALATVVLVCLDRFTRRLLPLAALLKLSLVFPDHAPSRFKVALRSGSVERLEEKVEAAASAAKAGTPSDAAARLLELVAALNIHDRLTRGHCERVRAYAVMIGEEMGLSKGDLDLLNWAALLHDVGKLRVPTEILTKEGRPSDREWAVLKQHPSYGEELVAPIRDWLGTWTSAIGFHHERWDGSGYPHGLQGDAIPLAGRIVAVADSFDVMTSARSYKQAGVAADARQELARCAGTQFDPHVVRAFLNVGLGRMRLVMGPLSWLAHAPLLARLPLTPAMGTLAGAFTVAAGSAAGGLVALPPVASAVPIAPASHVQHVSRHPTVARHRAPGLVRLVVPTERRRPVASPAIVAPPLQPVATPASQVPAPVPAPPAATPAPVPVDDRASVREGQSVAIDVLGNDGGGPLQLVSVGSPAHGSAVALDGDVVYAAPSVYLGSDSFTYTATGPGGKTASATVTVDVLPVNHAPTFAPGSDVSVLEDSAAYARPWAGDVDAGPGDGRQTVRFVVTPSKPGLFAQEPQVGADGTLSFTPAADANGDTEVRVTAVDDGGRANGGADRSEPFTFRIDVRPVNDPPSFTAGGDVGVDEGAGAQARLWATGITAGPANEADQHVTFTAAVDNPALFTLGGQPTVDPDGVLLFTPKPFASGTATVSVAATDDGGTANGGRDTTRAMFTISIRHVNQPPRFTGAGDLSVLEDSGPHASQWASSIDAGAPDESVQTVTLSAANDNPALFAAQPALDNSGHLTFTPAPDASGSATVTVTAKDDGGTAGSGRDTTSATFTITVAPVNDAPSFTGAGAQSVLEDAGTQSVQWATSISAGPADESGQTVALSASNDNSSLFSVQPAVSSSGVLSYTPAANASGSATVTVTAQDDGGTANGGVDTTSATFTITVTPVNDAPTIAAIADQAINEDDGTQSVSATSLTPGPADENGQSLTVTTTTDHPEYFDLAGAPTVNASGTLTYTPALGAIGVATVTVTVQDSGGVAYGGSDTASTTFTITIAALPPIAGDDAYTTTTVGGGLHVAAPGVLANDADVNSVTLAAVPFTNVPTAAGGTASLQADGTFDYSPPLSLLPFNDTLSYQVIDGNGQTATATISIAVTVLPAASSTLYLDTTGLSADVWNLVSSPVAAVAPVPDLDGDNHPGLTLNGSDGKEQVSEQQKQRAWAYGTGLLGLSLHGPLTLHLTAATENFGIGKPETVYLYVYDCPAGSSTISTTLCTKLGSNEVLFPQWSTTATYVTHDVTVAVDADLLPARQLRIRVLVGGSKLWIPLVAPYGSSVDYAG